MSAKEKNKMEEKEVVEVKPVEEKAEKAEVVEEQKPVQQKGAFSIVSFACGVVGLCCLFSLWGAIASIVLGIAAIVFNKYGAEHKNPFKIFKKLGRIFGKLSLILGIIVTVLLIITVVTLAILVATGVVDPEAVPDYIYNF